MHQGADGMVGHCCDSECIWSVPMKTKDSKRIGLFVLAIALSFVMSVQGKIRASEKAATSAGDSGKPTKMIPPDVWNEPVNPERLNGRIHHTFVSRTLGEDVGYLIYLPPSYERDARRRFPVIYWLHGVRGGLLKGSIFYRRYLEAMTNGEAPEVILVFPKGRHYSSYCDSVDGTRPVETVIIKELIPHIDRTYRTVAGRTGRAIEGSSMGGFGTFHLAFKYPELFCAATSLIGALNDAENIRDRSFETLDLMFGGSLERFSKESPAFLVRKNADRIRGKMAIRMYDGDKDFFYEHNEKFHELLNDLEIPHTYKVLSDVGHNQSAIYQRMGMEMFAFYGEVFSKADATEETPARRVDTHGLSLSGTDEWVDKNTQEPAGTKHKTFHSKTIGEDVFYLIYLPASYDTNPARRYPVVYWLHGRGRSPRVGFYFVERLMTAAANGIAPEMIVVLVNGRSNSMYCNSFDGKIPVETVIIKDLIPHVDRTYRTIATRQGRAVEGSSMGGFGALHLGFKYPNLFGVVTSLSAAISPPEEFKTREKERSSLQAQRAQRGKTKKSRPNLFEVTFGGNLDYARANSPWTLLEQQTDTIRSRTALRTIVGKEDLLLDVNRRFHAHLRQLEVPHEYIEVERGRHAYYEVIDRLTDKEIFNFYHKVFTPKP